MLSAKKVAARYRQGMFAPDLGPTEQRMSGADAAAIARLVRVPDPVYVPVDPMDLTWVYRQGLRGRARFPVYRYLRNLFRGGIMANTAAAVYSRSDLAQLGNLKSHNKQHSILEARAIPRDLLYAIISTKQVADDAKRWMVPIIHRHRGRWISSRPIIPWADLPTEDPKTGPAEAPADAPYGEYLFGELRQDVHEPDTPEEAALINALRSHYKGSGDDRSEPALSGAVAVALRKAHQDGLYPEWLQVPEKYRYAYRLMDNISERGLDKLTEDADDEDDHYNVLVTKGGTYKPHKGKVTSWTVSKEAITKMIEDWRYRLSAEYPEDDEHIAVAVADLNNVRDSFMLNPDRIAEIGLASDFTYQHEVLGWGSFPMDKLAWGVLSNDDWFMGRDQAEDNERRLEEAEDDEDSDLDWTDLEGWSSVEEFDSDMASFYAKARKDLIQELLSVL
jgi:hypothetical protein